MKKKIIIDLVFLFVFCLSLVLLESSTPSNISADDGKQFGNKTVFEEPQELPGAIPSGVEAVGVIIFPAISDSGNIKLVFDKHIPKILPLKNRYQAIQTTQKLALRLSFNK